MEQRIGSYESGELTLRKEAAAVRISVHWPYDRETDEWIDLTTVLPFATFAHGVDPTERAVNIVVEAGEEFRLRHLADGRFRLRLRGRNSINAVEADLILSAGIGDSLLESLASMVGQRTS